MQTMILELQGCENYKESLRRTCKGNGIGLATLNGLTVNKMRLFYERTLKHYDSNPLKAKASWFQNQLRLYHWVLIAESFLLGLLLNQFQQPQWAKIQTYFFPKPMHMLQFEAKKLASSSPSQMHRSWNSQQCQALKVIMEDQSLINQWNEVSRRLYECTGRKWYRSSKQCREQWFNHMDHSKKHGEWTLEEDVAILEFVLRSGHKWATICRDWLPSRTEHMIKNRFKSLLIKSCDYKQKAKYSERKLIRNILLKVKNQKNQMQETAFKINNLKTFQTENQIAYSHSESSFPQPPTILKEHLDSIQQINNRNSQQGQFYQNGTAAPPGLVFHSSHLPALTSYFPQPAHNLLNFYPSLQKTNGHFLNFAVSSFAPNIYSGFPAAILFGATVPHNPQ